MAKNYILGLGLLFVLGANQASADSFVIVLEDSSFSRSYFRTYSSCDRTSPRYPDVYTSRYPTYVRQPNYYRTPLVSSYSQGCSPVYRSNRYYNSVQGFRSTPYPSIRVMR